MKNKLILMLSLFAINTSVIYSQDFGVSDPENLINNKNGEKEVINNGNKNFEKWSNTRTGNYGLPATPELGTFKVSNGQKYSSGQKSVVTNRLSQLADESNAKVEDTSKFDNSPLIITSDNNENDYILVLLPIILVSIILVYLFLVNPESFSSKNSNQNDNLNSSLNNNKIPLNIIDELNKLQNLKEQGIINNEEFISIKNTLLKNMS
ncbi:MAG: hypothetical protein KA210_05330 [Bacteroidia bacterium]|nr:hypothetical protein [Bacteroidia bacterium]